MGLERGAGGFSRDEIDCYDICIEISRPLSITSSDGALDGIGSLVVLSF